MSHPHEAWLEYREAGLTLPTDPRATVLQIDAITDHTTVDPTVLHAGHLFWLDEPALITRHRQRLPRATRLRRRAKLRFRRRVVACPE